MKDKPLTDKPLTDKHFIGLVQSILSSAQAALGETHSPMATHLAKDGILRRETAERGLELLNMLQRKTLGNLNETERDALYQAQKAITEKLAVSGKN
ncbi:MAG: DUF1844 domain-containing protein [Trueperaceae bacterium]